MQLRTFVAWNIGVTPNREKPHSHGWGEGKWRTAIESYFAYLKNLASVLVMSGRPH